MTLELMPHGEQSRLWPSQGRHLLAQSDAASIVVYQAYRPEIAEFAVKHQRFGGPWSLSRMSWIKPGFLWMMHRSGWATKEGQERVLAIRMRRDGFDHLLAACVHASFVAEVYQTTQAWQERLAASHVRLQWDPDHGPDGAPLARRAIQLGLRGPCLQCFASEWVVAIEDISGLVAEQRAHRDRRQALLTPREQPYPVADPAVRSRLGLADG